MKAKDLIESGIKVPGYDDDVPEDAFTRIEPLTSDVIVEAVINDEEIGLIVTSALRRVINIPGVKESLNANLDDTIKTITSVLSSMVEVQSDNLAETWPDVE